MIKDIAETLRFAAPYLDEKSERKCIKLADKVEQIRCETCSDRFKVTGNDGEGIPCPWVGCGGCFHHKFKEVENG